MFSFFFINYFDIMYYYFMKVPLWNFFMYSISFCFVTFYSELTLWNLMVFMKSFFDYFIGSMYYTHVWYTFLWVDYSSYFWFTTFKLNYYMQMFFGFTWTAIKMFDFPEKIEMLVSLYMYMLMLDIVSDSYNSIINNFFMNNIFEEFLMDGNNNELLFIIIDIVMLLINGFFFSETEFLFF